MTTHTSTQVASSSQSHALKPWWMHKRSKQIGIVTICIATLGFCGWLICFHPYVSTDDARVAATLVRVAPEGTTGKVIKLYTKEGDRIQKGMVLLELDHRVAESNLLKTKARAQQAQKELKRMEQLASQNGIPPRELDNARANEQTARADLDLAQIAYDRTFLKSPIDGIVVQKSVEIGNILEQNQTAMTIADVENAWISANIEETSVAEVKPGQKVSVTIDEGGILSGRVSEIRDATASQFALIQSENPSGNFTKLVQRIPIRVELDPHPNQLLRAGESVEIKIRVR